VELQIKSGEKPKHTAACTGRLSILRAKKEQIDLGRVYHHFETKRNAEEDDL